MKIKQLVLVIIVLSSSISINGNIRSTIDSLIFNINSITLHQKVNDTNKINEFITLSDYGSHNDAAILQLFFEVHLPEELAVKYIDSQNNDGSWDDINYKDKNNSAWSPSGHVSRILSLSVIYNTSSSTYYKNKKVSETIHKAMDYWFKLLPKSPNWWYNEIGVPKLFGPAFLLMKDEMSEDEMQNAIEVMSNSKIAMTGQNKVWLSGNVFMKALLENNIKEAYEARNSIISEIKLGSGEGLQPDYSFHQHGPQVQFGNYGLSYISTMAYWARIFANTSMSINNNQIQLLRDYMTKGIMWCVWNGYFDVNACARQVFNNTQQGKANSLAIAAINMSIADPKHSQAYDKFSAKNLFNTSSNNNLNGFKYFWRSDYGVLQTQKYFASVRMCSSRTIGHETTNKENLQGYFSADGAMMINIEGDEYNNIFPIWDWRHLPGVTNYDNGLPLPNDNSKIPINKSNFVGGMSSFINETNGITAMILDKNDLYAHKANFFINGTIISLGAGISYSHKHPVSTTINQTLLKGDVKIKSSSDILLKDQSKWEGSDVKYVYHNNIAYIPGNKSNISISNNTQNGSWSNIAKFYKKDSISDKVFKMYIDHGIAPQNGSYSYFILPNASIKEAESFYKKPTVKVISNTTNCQAVSTNDNSLVNAVFYKPFKLELAKGSYIEALDNCIISVLFDKNKKISKIYASDPTQTLKEIRLKYYPNKNSKPETIVVKDVFLNN